MGVARGQNPDEALREAFGMGPADFEQELRRYVQRSAFRSTVFVFPAPRARGHAGSGTPRCKGVMSTRGCGRPSSAVSGAARRRRRESKRRSLRRRPRPCRNSRLPCSGWTRSGPARRGPPSSAPWRPRPTTSSHSTPTECRGCAIRQPPVWEWIRPHNGDRSRARGAREGSGHQSFLVRRLRIFNYAEIIADNRLAEARTAIARATICAPGRIDYRLRYADNVILEGKIAEASALLIDWRWRRRETP